MGSAGVALDGGYIMGEVLGVFGGVGFAAGASGFLIHPGDHAEGAGGAQVKALENFGGLHGHDYAGSVVDGSGAEVPGIEMAGDHYDLFGMFGTFEIGDYVVAGFIRKLLRCQSEVHADFAFRGEMGDQVGVFGGDGGGRDSGGEAESGVRESVVGIGYGADQGGNGAEISGGFGSGSAIADGLAIGGESLSADGLLLVEDFIEEDDLAGDLVAAESLKFFEGVDGDYVCGEAICGCSRASAEGGEDNLLRGGGHHAGILDQGGGFGAAYPVRHGDGLEADIEAEVAKFFGYVFCSGAGLGRAGGAGSDVLGEVREFAVGVVVVQRSGFDGGKLLQKKRREILFVSLRGLRLGHHLGRGGLRLGRGLSDGDGGGQ